MPTKTKKTGKRSPSKSRTAKSAAWSPKEGENVCIRTVTHYHVGKYMGRTDRGDFIMLDRAAWVADTGRFSSFITSGTVNEVEPFDGPCCVAVGAIVDISPWRHALLEVVK